MIITIMSHRKIPRKITTMVEGFLQDLISVEMMRNQLEIDRMEEIQILRFLVRQRILNL